MPTRFVGIHLSLVGIVALFGLSFIADPCGGGDLCLGGVLGLYSLGLAAVGGIGLVVWQVGRRASPLLVWDCVLLAVAGFIVMIGSASSPGLLMLGALLATLLSLFGAVLAGREVAVHRTERLLALAAVVVLVIPVREAALVVLVLTLLALGLGSRLAREDRPPAA